MIRPFGEGALLVEVDSADDAQRLASMLGAKRLPSVIEAIPGLASVLVEIDPLSDVEATTGAIEELRGAPSAPPEGRLRTIPVVYGGAHGPDLADVADICGLTQEQVVDLHAGTELRALFVGFAPGFAYLGDLPEPIRVPRLGTPRTRTPAGSVAIAGALSGIYPAELPGGWRVIGRTPLILFDPRREPPGYIGPGDRVRFVPIRDDESGSARVEAADWE